MVSVQRVVSQQIPAEPAEVRAFYVDLHQLTTLHPLVVSVQATDRRPISDGYQQSYLIRDRIPLGPLTLPIRYRTRMTVPETGDVVAESHQFPHVRLYTVVSFRPCGGGTQLTEQMRIHAPRPIARVTVRQAVNAHREMLARVAAMFDGGVSREF